VLKEPVEFFLRRLLFRVGRLRVGWRDSGFRILFLFDAACTLDLCLGLFVHLPLTLGECILIFCDWNSP
jgi:hypothetical protein